MFRWSPVDRKWISFLGFESCPLRAFSPAACRDTVFVTGGKQTKLFDLNSGTWNDGPDLLQGRYCHGMAVVRDRVYAVAGLNYRSLSSVEEFKQTTGQWIHAGDLEVPTSGCGVTAIGDTILVAGGDTDQSQSLIQTFNVQTRTAAVLDVSLPRPMRHVRAARLGNTAFFVGREGDMVQVTEVDGKFQMTSHVQLQGFRYRIRFGLQVTDFCVRVVGGGSSSVDCWNHQGQRMENAEEWSLPEKMRVERVRVVDFSFP